MGGAAAGRPIHVLVTDAMSDSVALMTYVVPAVAIVAAYGYVPEPLSPAEHGSA